MESIVNPAETAAIQPISKPKRRKLTLQDAESIAQLVAESRLTETEACLNLDINPQQWFIFKQRHKTQAKFDDILTRIKGSSIGHAMQTIKNCGDGIGMKQPDWRAHAFRLSVIAPERFNPSKDQSQQQNPPQVNVSVLVALKDVYAKATAQIEPKQLANAPQSVVIEESSSVPQS